MRHSIEVTLEVSVIKEASRLGGLGSRSKAGLKKEDVFVCFRHSFPTVADKGQTQHHCLARLSWRKQPQAFETMHIQKRYHKSEQGAK